jgi:hypothetical protein
MSAIDLIAKMHEGLHESYKYQRMVLSEPQEKMNVPFSRFENNDIVLIRPKDNEKETLWACFSDEVNRDIADYIAFKAIDNTVVCFIFELKKRKTSGSTLKVNNQLHSTYPLVKMIYEKITGENAKTLKIIGIKVFGTGEKPQIKESRGERRKLPKELAKENENFLIGHFIQNTKDAPLTSLSHFYRESSRLFTN